MKKLLLSVITVMAVALGFLPGATVHAGAFDTLREYTLSYGEKKDFCSLESQQISNVWYYWWLCEYDYNDVYAERFILNLPNSLYLDDNNTAITSKLEIFDDTPAEIAEIELADVFSGGVPNGGEVEFWFSNLDGVDVRGEGVTLKLTIACSFNSVPGGGYVEGFYNEESGVILTFTTRSVMVRFIHNGAIISSQALYHTMPDVPTEPTKANYVFTGWVDGNGDMFNFSGVLDETLINEDTGIMYLYSTFLAIADVDIEPDELTPGVPAFLSSFLDTFSADNTTGYTALYAILTFVLIAVMLGLHAPAFGVVVAHAILTVAFVLMGVLEFFILIGVIILYAIIFIKKSRAPDYDEGA